MEHPPPSPLICPIIRLQYSSFFTDKRVNGRYFCMIDHSYSLNDVSSHDDHRLDPCHVHRLDPLYWCNNKKSRDEPSWCGVVFVNVRNPVQPITFALTATYPTTKSASSLRPLIKSPHHPKHSLQLIMPSEPTMSPRKIDLICDVCGLVDSKTLIYVCLECGFVVHTKCIYLPFVIKISSHDHHLSFMYSPSIILSCGVRHQKVDENYRKYYCTKDCTYIVHSNCATWKDVWDGKELKQEPEEEYENLNSFEVIGDGIIQHLRYSHCMRYVCSEGGESINLDVRCAAISEPFDHQLHPHPLFLSNELGIYRPCSMCEKSSFRTLINCIECDFSLCFYCATLPYKVRYEHDEHLLIFSYEENASLNCCELKMVKANMKIK
ncbi:hypothetical protein Bca4012_005485 [Brassica carinata]|uniref:(rape) hypothetical protein n=1 Tax=Brassica napus TaxID=3708 RepID=A0A078J0J8_BRANA|nr:unnamed protein product [Brassica napus]CDY56481.1 BnaCnng30400D [Brassica napus]